MRQQQERQKSRVSPWELHTARLNPRRLCAGTSVLQNFTAGRLGGVDQAESGRREGSTCGDAEDGVLAGGVGVHEADGEEEGGAAGGRPAGGRHRENALSSDCKQVP